MYGENNNGKKNKRTSYEIIGDILWAGNGLGIADIAETANVSYRQLIKTANKQQTQVHTKDRFDYVAQIIQAVISGRKKRYNIRSYVYMTDKQTKDHIEYSCSKGFLVEKDDGNFEVTQRGSEFLEHYRALNSILETKTPINSQNSGDEGYMNTILLAGLFEEENRKFRRTPLGDLYLVHYKALRNLVGQGTPVEPESLEITQLGIQNNISNSSEVIVPHSLVDSL